MRLNKSECKVEMGILTSAFALFLVAQSSFHLQFSWNQICSHPSLKKKEDKVLFNWVFNQRTVIKEPNVVVKDKIYVISTFSSSKSYNSAAAKSKSINISGSEF